VEGAWCDRLPHPKIKGRPVCRTVASFRELFRLFTEVNYAKWNIDDASVVEGAGNSCGAALALSRVSVQQ